MLEKLKFYRNELIVFFTAFSWLVLHWLYNFPAIYTYDGIHYIFRIVELGKTPGNLAWESTLYELYVFLMVWLSPLMTTAALFQIFLFSLLTTNLFSFFQRVLKMNRLAYLFVALFLLAPSNIFVTLMTERDNLFAIVGCFGLLILFRFLSGQNKRSLLNYMGLIFIFGLMSALRKEACFILVLLPLMALFPKQQERFKNFLIHLGLISVVFVFYLFFASSLYGTQSTSQYFGNYNLSALVRSVSYILVHKSETLNAEDQKFVESLVDIEKLKNISDISEMEFQTWYQPTTTEGMIRFYSLAIRLILKYPDLFLQFRTDIFEKNLKIPMVATAYLREGPYYRNYPEFNKLQESLHLKTHAVLPESSFFKNYYQNTIDWKSLLFKLSSPLIAFGILFTILLCFRITPISSLLTTLPLLHGFIVFLAQQGPGMKYYYFAYSSCFLISMFFVWELKGYFRGDVKALQR